ncbi:MAG: hydroxymethylglutaryl-CoA lyase [Proteobacteria bacterium]|nr:hydroxymethylglutaryl-CoA lyase [Pseudomonadota bacterium]
MKDSIFLREVGLRDGLQLVKTHLSTEIKLAWISEQSKAGFGEIEVTSFVPQKLLPQFSDAEELMVASNNLPNLRASALVLNVKGAIRALECGTKKVTFVLSASEMHNKSNVKCSTDDSLAMFFDILNLVKEKKYNVEIAGAIATSFGCSIQGDVSERRVIDLAGKMLAAGASEIILADTVGYANPMQVKHLFSMLNSIIGKRHVAAHFHDTRLANVVAAIDGGVRRFDSALGGLGGCPFAPGASGNIATEDCAYLLESMGFSTNVDFAKLLLLRKKLSSWLPNEKLEGRLGAARPAINFPTELISPLI